MSLQQTFEQYWPLGALAMWWGYKWWKSRRVVAMLPELKNQGALFVDVRSAGEYASACAPCTINIPLPELGRRLAEIPKSAPVVVFKSLMRILLVPTVPSAVTETRAADVPAARTSVSARAVPSA